MNTKLPPITGTAEIALSVRSIPTMQQFYTEVLGFQLHSEAAYNAKGEYVPEGEPTITFLTISETDSPLGRSGHPQLLALIDHRRHTSSRPGHNPDTSTLHHLAFEIPPASYDAYLNYLTELKLEPRQVDFTTAKSLFVKDPEGNSIELICHSPKPS